MSNLYIDPKQAASRGVNRIGGISIPLKIDLIDPVVQIVIDKLNEFCKKGLYLSDNSQELDKNIQSLISSIFDGIRSLKQIPPFFEGKAKSGEVLEAYFAEKGYLLDIKNTIIINNAVTRQTFHVLFIGLHKVEKKAVETFEGCFTDFINGVSPNVDVLHLGKNLVDFNGYLY
ncbi:MAG: hypothetical protein ABIH39_05545 [Candidatus Margulisiibacteriota bacterium]